MLKEKEITDEGTNKNYGGNKYYSDNNHDNAFTGTMFYFDPNTLDETGWKKLGLRNKTIATIQNYVSKGGKFRKAADITKIWGLRDDEKERLLPYVRIAEKPEIGNSYANAYTPYERKPYEKKVPATVDINTGDSSAFVLLPGIGPGFSRRIINFRHKLGGFYKVEQVAETFGLPDSVFQKIKPLLKISRDNIRKINLNTASNEELKAHPYIRWQLANIITEYKKQHGHFKTIDGLKKIMTINEETYNRILPYLTL